MNQQQRADLGRISGNIPGAVRILIDLFQEHGAEIWTLFDKNKVYGKDIWYLYDDECGKSYNAMLDSLRDGTAVDKLKKNTYSTFYQR